MIVGHCPECGMAITGDNKGRVQACMHTPPVLLILASMFGEAFDEPALNPRGTTHISNDILDRQ